MGFDEIPSEVEEQRGGALPEEEVDENTRLLSFPFDSFGFCGEGKDRRNRG